MEQTNPAAVKPKLESDTRLDPRIKRRFAGMPQAPETSNVSSREELLAQESTPAAQAAMKHQKAGLNGCISGLKWVHAKAAVFGIDPKRILVGGESGGGNLTPAFGMKLKRDGELGLVQASFATREDVESLPTMVISVNECDPLLDEGIAFYRLLLASGVAARCRQMMGACHGIERFFLFSVRILLTLPPATSPTSRARRLETETN